MVVFEKMGLLAHICNSNVWEAEARGLSRSCSQPGLQTKTLSQKTNKKGSDLIER